MTANDPTVRRDFDRTDQALPSEAFRQIIDLGGGVSTEHALPGMGFKFPDWPDGNPLACEFDAHCSIFPY